MGLVAAGLAGVAAVGLGLVWIIGRDRPPAPSPALRHSAPATKGLRRANTPPPVESPEVPFLEPAGEGALAYHSADYPSALERFKAVVDANPNDAESLSNLGQVLVRLGRANEALPYFQRAIAIIPDRWAYRFNMARALGLVGRLDESIAGYREAQRLFPNDYATAFNLGLMLHKKGDDAAAVEAYKRAIDLEPDDASFRMALGISYERLQRPADAAAAYDEYLRLSPSAADADKVRARIAALKGSSQGS